MEHMSEPRLDIPRLLQKIPEDLGDFFGFDETTDVVYFCDPINGARLRPHIPPANLDIPLQEGLAHLRTFGQSEANLQLNIILAHHGDAGYMQDILQDEPCKEVLLYSDILMLEANQDQVSPHQSLMGPETAIQGGILLPESGRAEFLREGLRWAAHHRPGIAVAAADIDRPDGELGGLLADLAYSQDRLDPADYSKEELIAMRHLITGVFQTYRQWGMIAKMGKALGEYRQRSDQPINYQPIKVLWPVDLWHRHVIQKCEALGVKVRWRPVHTYPYPDSEQFMHATAHAQLPRDMLIG